MAVATGLQERIEAVRASVACAAERAGRGADAVTLVAVTKTVDRSVVDEAYALGLRHFAENRVQAAAAKFARPLPPEATLHLVGQLQTNKVRPATTLFSIVESVDRASLVDALEKEGARAGRVMPILLQINVAGERQKAGCSPDAAPTLLAHALSCPHLAVRGLMTIAPLVDDPEETRHVFRGLRELRDRLMRHDGRVELGILSMGMSNDFHVAIEEGATHVRIGRAVFAG